MPLPLPPSPAAAPVAKPSARTKAGAILSTAREAELLQAIAALAGKRAAAEARTAAEFRAGTSTAEEEFAAAQQTLPARRDAEVRTAESEYASARASIVSRRDSDRAATEREAEQELAEIAAARASGSEETDKARDEAVFQARQVFEATKDQPARQYAEFQGQLDATVQSLLALREETRGLLVIWRQPQAAALTIEDESPQRAEQDPLAVMQECVTIAQTQRAVLAALQAPPLFKGATLVLFYGSAWLPVLGVTWLAMGTPHALWVSLLVNVVLCTLGTVLLHRVARKQVGQVWPPLVQAVRDAEFAHARALETAAVLRGRQETEIAEKRDRSLRQAVETHRARSEEIRRRHERDLARTEATYPVRLRDIAGRAERELAAIEEARERRVTAARQQHDAQWTAAQERHRRATRELTERHDAEWQALADEWMNGLGAIHAGVAEIGKLANRLFPQWQALAERPWPPAEEIPPAIRFGQFQLRMDQIPHGVPTDDRLAALAPAAFTLPAVVPFPKGCSLLFKARGEGRAKAVEAMQAAMLRLLTSLPAAKARLTIVDPVGLGENFAAFMHLGDYDEALVNSRIWTEPRHIEQRLVDLSEHMENVIQKYLRNEFATIEEYNEYAGEVAEAFRFLVVANFPAGFTEAAARRLMSIAASGARCGVYTLVSVDVEQPLPDGFDLKELEQQGTTLIWKKDRFVWKNADFRDFPFTLDSPPPAEQFTKILHAVGRHAKDAARVEVPFEFIAPAEGDCWTFDTRAGIDVPLGRAGATRLQHMRLGHGTSQHVLVAGKTGSGKSTLLHALITNAALRFSPDEIELYLVDFKKGVEFKTYATHALPHARVIAIESDREFGLSVLDRLDAELKRRADAFRNEGVQDIAGFRASRGEALPRILLVVDEFQELFTEDDKIAQESALLLDRLVRQGRAFGIHVLLGSQTLGGAYSLARSTIGQMAVRIALQCSEADAHLILSEDNTAARLLSRAGEAIYNDSNGLIEGNHPFQVVWLADERREEYLRHIQRLAQARTGPPRPQVVFEGNIPAEIEKNHLLAGLLGGATRPAERDVACAWMGDPVAIKDPTAAVFRPQSGGNLLMIGQNDDAALGITAAALVSLAAQQLRDGAKFYLLDGSPAGSPQSAALASLVGVAPESIRLVSWRELAEVMNELATEVEARQQPDAARGAPRYLFLYGLQRFRDLRRDEDDFGFSRGEAPPSPAKQLPAILRDGPGLGIHALVWCDSLNNLNRTWDRNTLREFEMRVVFQMGANDSSTLIDTPAAARLGFRRAIFHSEEQGALEKFRPYGFPSAEWLGEVAGKLGAK